MLNILKSRFFIFP